LCSTKVSENKYSWITFAYNLVHAALQSKVLSPLSNFTYYSRCKPLNIDKI